MPLLLSYLTFIIQLKKRLSRNNEVGIQTGIDWQWIRRGELPPNSRRKASKGSDTASFKIHESLFADDTTLIGIRQEIKEGSEIIKATLGEFEEKCHDGKEERVNFGREGAGNIRMLGVWLGRSFDTRERIKRAGKCWFLVKKRLRKNKLSRRTRARVVEACVESSLLFDCQVRPWRVSEIKRLQSFIDKAYRSIWMERKKGPALRQMEAKHVRRKGQAKNTIDS